jgi:beta-lactam-binding protein with PASTA domain
VTREQSAPGGRSPLPGVFISYRREFDAGWAPWLYDRLSDHFGASRIFMDLDSIAAGDDFVEVITHSVASCRVLIALIGKDWAGALDAQGKRRLDDRGDFVRLEIESALKHGIRVIPLLIEGATMPPPAELPTTLAPIVYRQALTLTASHRRYEAENLVKAVERALDQPVVEPIQVPSPPVVPPTRPPSQLRAAVQPTVARGLRGSNIEVRLTNSGQAPRSVVLRTTALPDRVRITPDRVRVQVPAGATTKTRIRVHAPTPLWRGKGRDVGVRVQIGAPDVVPATLESRFRQRPMFGLPALIAVLVLAVGLSIALPNRAGADVVVPSVATDESSARIALQQAGLKVAVSTIRSSTIPKGKIIQTGPAAGTRVPRDSIVILYVSAGAAASHTPSPSVSAKPTKTGQGGCSTVPPVIGLSKNAARSAIRNAGLGYHTVYQHSGSVAAGDVISTKPEAGASACNGVELYVSSGPPEVTVPALTGLSQQEAQQALDRRGLSSRLIFRTSDSDAAAGTVIESDPAEGQEVPADTQVTLVIAAQPSAPVSSSATTQPDEN